MRIGAVPEFQFGRHNVHRSPAVSPAHCRVLRRFNFVESERCHLLMKTSPLVVGCEKVLGDPPGGA